MGSAPLQVALHGPEIAGAATQWFRPTIAEMEHVWDACPMRLSRTWAVALLLTACSSPEERDHEALMGKIEQQVRLPKGARTLGEYARYYANGDDGEVIAVYLLPFNDDPRPGDSCEELTENFTSRQVPCPSMHPTWAMPAGKRRWVKDQHDLPFISDGGCAQVTVVFDKSRSAIKSAECNGTA